MPVTLVIYENCVAFDIANAVVTAFAALVVAFSK